MEDPTNRSALVMAFRLAKFYPVAYSDQLADFGLRDISIHCETIEVVEPGLLGPCGQIGLTLGPEYLGEFGLWFAGLHIPRWYNAPLAGISSMKQDGSDTKRHNGVSFPIESVFPESRRIGDFQVGPKANRHFLLIAPWVPGRHFVQRRCADKGWSGSLLVVWKASARVLLQEYV